MYRILLGRTVVLVSVLYWYLLEAIRFRRFSKTTRPENIGLGCSAWRFQSLFS